MGVPYLEVAHEATAGGGGHGGGGGGRTREEMEGAGWGKPLKESCVG